MDNSGISQSTPLQPNVNGIVQAQQNQNIGNQSSQNFEKDIPQNYQNQQAQNFSQGLNPQNQSVQNGQVNSSVNYSTSQNLQDDNLDDLDLDDLFGNQQMNVMAGAIPTQDEIDKRKLENESNFAGSPTNQDRYSGQPNPGGIESAPRQENEPTYEQKIEQLDEILDTNLTDEIEQEVFGEVNDVDEVEEGTTKMKDKIDNELDEIKAKEEGANQFIPNDPAAQNINQAQQIPQQQFNQAHGYPVQSGQPIQQMQYGQPQQVYPNMQPVQGYYPPIQNQNIQQAPQNMPMQGYPGMPMPPQSQYPGYVPPPPMGQSYMHAQPYYAPPAYVPPMQNYQNNVPQHDPLMDENGNLIPSEDDFLPDDF